MAMKAEQWTPNCGAPLDPEKIKAGLMWDAEIKLWVRPEEVGAQIHKPPKEWWKLFK